MPETSTTLRDGDLVVQLIEKFIARADVKALQVQDGGYRPVVTEFTPYDIDAHLHGDTTFGHYLVGAGNQCKFFAFDCDLNETGTWLPDWQERPTGIPEEGWLDENYLLHHSIIRGGYPRADWHDRAHPSRPFHKQRMFELAALLTSAIRDNLGIPALAAYSGNKGIHVYGLTGLMPAADVREAAKLVLAATGRFAPSKGDNFYVDTHPDWRHRFGNFTIEVFPKQDTVEPGHYGNLLRLPLGKNQKNPADPTFLIDLEYGTSTLVPIANPAEFLGALS